jgi:hypothetical protein
MVFPDLVAGCGISIAGASRPSQAGRAGPNHVVLMPRRIRRASQSLLGYLNAARLPWPDAPAAVKEAFLKWEQAVQKAFEGDLSPTSTPSARRRKTSGRRRPRSSATRACRKARRRGRSFRCSSRRPNHVHRALESAGDDESGRRVRFHPHTVVSGHLLTVHADRPDNSLRAQPSADDGTGELPVTESCPPLPPFRLDTALAKVQAAEDAWNTRDPHRGSPRLRAGLRVA